MQPRLAKTRAVAIDGVADDRPALSRRMYAQLMGPACQRFHREPRKRTGPTEHSPLRDCDLPLRVRFLPPAALGILSPERQLDNAFVLGGTALDDGPIGLVYLAMLEQKAERGGRLAMAAQHETTRGVLVEPMCEHRRPRQAKSQCIERCFKVGTALGPAMHRQTSGLVDDQHQAVAMKNPRPNFFCRQFWNIHRLSR